MIFNFQQPVLFLTWIWHSSGLAAHGGFSVQKGYPQCNNFWKQNHQPECVSCTEIVFPYHSKINLQVQGKLCLQCPVKIHFVNFWHPLATLWYIAGACKPDAFYSSKHYQGFFSQFSFPAHKSPSSFWRVHLKRWRWDLLSTLVSGT